MKRTLLKEGLPNEVLGPMKGHSPQRPRKGCVIEPCLDGERWVLQCYINSHCENDARCKLVNIKPITNLTSDYKKHIQERIKLHSLQ